MIAAMSEIIAKSIIAVILWLNCMIPMRIKACWNSVDFDNLDEAYKAYLAHISFDNDLRFTFYCDQNGEKPLGCPRPFLNYFDCEDDDCDIEQLKKTESSELLQIQKEKLPAISSSKIRC